MRFTLLLAAVLYLAGAQGAPSTPPSGTQDNAAFLQAQFTALPPPPPADARRIDDLLRQMTVAEKVGQMTQLEIGMVTDGSDLDLRINPDKLRKAVVEYGAGG